MKFSVLTTSIAAGVLVTGCSSIWNKPETEFAAASENRTAQSIEISSPRKDSESAMRAEALARFATGLSYEINSKPDLAIEQFYHASMADPSNEDLAIDLSRRFLQLRKPEKAVEVLSHSAKRRDASGNLFSWLARAQVIAGETNSAVESGYTAVKRSPTLIAGYQVLSEIFLQIGKTEDAEKILERAARQQKVDVAFLIKLGELHANAANSQTKNATALKKRGLKILDRAEQLNPENPNVRQKLADHFAQLGDPKKAANIYLQLLDEYRDVPLMRDAMREKLANLYLREKDKPRAMEQLEAVVRDNPTRYPEAWYLLGTLANEGTNYVKAAEYFERALVVNPEMEPVYYDLAGMQINLNQAGEALKTLEKAREKFPNSFTTEFFTGLAYSRMKNFASALKHFTAAEVIANVTATNRLNHLFYFQIGATFERNGEYDQAAKYFERSIQLAPDFSDALNYLGYMWTDRGENLEKARELIERALKQEPSNAAYLDSLGWVLFKLNQPEQALKHLLKAAELSEEPDAVVYDHIGDVYRALKQHEKAREAWEKSISIEPSEVIQKKLQAEFAL